MPSHFDAHRHRTGQAGPPSPRASRRGMKVAIIEKPQVRRHLRVNDGCTPTKAMVASAYAARLAARGAEYGVQITGDARVDLKASRRARTPSSQPRAAT